MIRACIDRPAYLLSPTLTIRLSTAIFEGICEDIRCRDITVLSTDHLSLFSLLGKQEA
jgi:hypothetical protein